MDRMEESKLIMGVGSGDGKLFVEGDYNSIKELQSKLLELEENRRELKKLREIIRELDPMKFDKIEKNNP